ncbi:hypothetical protein ACFLYS_01000 [Chloroflexota bacterium]
MASGCSALDNTDGLCPGDDSGGAGIMGNVDHRGYDSIYRAMRCLVKAGRIKRYKQA